MERRFFAAVVTDGAELHLPLDDDIEAIALVAFREEDLATGEADLIHRGGEGASRLIIECDEERALSLPRYQWRP